MHSMKESCIQKRDWYYIYLLSQGKETHCFRSFSEDNTGWRLLDVLPSGHKSSSVTFTNCPKMFVSRTLAGIFWNSILCTSVQFIPVLLRSIAILSESQFLDSDIQYFGSSQVSEGKTDLPLLTWASKSSLLRQGSRKTCGNHDL